MADVHARGAIHRDLKSANIMVSASVEMQVTDRRPDMVMPGGGVADEKQMRGTRR